MRKRIAIAAAVAVLVLVAAGWADPRPKAPVAVGLAEIPALGTPDTAAVLIRWGAVVDARGQPVVRYLWQLRDIAAASNLAADSTTQLADTVRVARPLPGDSLIVQAAVAARDSKGKQSPWGMSGRLVLPGKPWLPPPAPPVTIDTLALAPADSAWIVAYGPRVAVTERGPARVAMDIAPGDTVDLCLYMWREGRQEAARFAVTWTFPDPDVVWPAGTSNFGAHCTRAAISTVATTGQVGRALHVAHVQPRSLVFRDGA